MAIERAKTPFPQFPIAIRFQAATVMLARKDPAGAVALLAKENVTPAERLLRGRAKESLGDYAGAWADWTGAKADLAQHQGHVYWRDHFAQRIRRPDRDRPAGALPALDAGARVGSRSGAAFRDGFPAIGNHDA